MIDLRAEGLSLGYHDGPVVVSGLDVEIPPGSITSIVGANGCGKSTLLRALARLLAPREGTVVLDGQSIHSQKTKEIAKRIGLLPQGPVVPDGLIVDTSLRGDVTRTRACSSSGRRRMRRRSNML